MADLATLQARLDEAETAEHLLMVSRTVVSVGHGDEQVTYSRAKLPDLQAYISKLKADIKALEDGRPRRTALLVEF